MTNSIEIQIYIKNEIAEGGSLYFILKNER
jgi:hypothetical protein